MATITLDLTWDRWWWMPDAKEDADFLRSPAGTWYEVEDVRRVASTRHPDRYRFTVRRLGRFIDPEKPEEWTPMDRVIDFFWYPRR